jgi:hypothetical protein
MIDPKERFGFMRDVEADLLEELLDTLKAKFGQISFLEVGVFGAGTTRGIYRRAKEIDCPVRRGIGVDFEQYRPNPTPDAAYEFHGVDSMDAWRSITGTVNFLFVDGCHCVNHAQCDFLNYSPFVEVGGYCLFHDTALPDGKYDQEPWPQTDHSYAGKPPSILGVREALRKLGLLEGKRTDWKLIKELESNTGLMGMCLFQRLA